MSSCKFIVSFWLIIANPSRSNESDGFGENGSLKYKKFWIESTSSL